MPCVGVRATMLGVLLPTPVLGVLLRTVPVRNRRGGRRDDVAGMVGMGR